MGMFDSVKCRYPVPDPECQNLDFQTKDLEQTLSEYVILEDGRLVVRRRDVEWVDDPSAFLGSHMVTKRSWWEEDYHHGDVVIYGLKRSDKPAEGDNWVEYVVRFTRGRVESISRADEIRPHREVIEVQPYWEEPSL